MNFGLSSLDKLVTPLLLYSIITFMQFYVSQGEILKRNLINIDFDLNKVFLTILPDETGWDSELKYSSIRI